LPHNYSDRLYKLRIDNALSITDFILALKIEVNLSAHHIMNNIMALTLLSQRATASNKTTRTLSIQFNKDAKVIDIIGNKSTVQ
jgi:hypothetical protein